MMRDWVVTLEVTIEATSRFDALEKVAKIVEKENKFLFCNVYDAELSDVDSEIVEPE